MLTLRHTFAIHLAIRGATLLDIMKALGHKDYRSTLRYAAHITPEHEHDVVAVLDDPPPAKRKHSGNKEDKAG